LAATKNEGMAEGCGKGRASALKSRPRLFECLDCGRQTSLTAGTAMHRSKLPLSTWFWAAHVMATQYNGMSARKRVSAYNGMSARQLEDQLGVTYKTAWLLTQKLRRSMIDPDRYLLEGVVEVDQTEFPFRVGDAFFKPSAGGKVLVAGAVEVTDRNGGKPRPRRSGAAGLSRTGAVPSRDRGEETCPPGQPRGQARAVDLPPARGVEAASNALAQPGDLDAGVGRRGDQFAVREAPAQSNCLKRGHVGMSLCPHAVVGRSRRSAG